MTISPLNGIGSSGIGSSGISTDGISGAPSSATLLFADSYTAADNTLLTARTPDSNSVGTAYQTFTTPYASAKIVSNKATGSAAGTIGGNYKTLTTKTWAAWIRGIKTSVFVQFGVSNPAYNRFLVCSFTQTAGVPNAVLVDHIATHSTTAMTGKSSTNFDAFITYDNGTLSVYNDARVPISSYSSGNADILALEILGMLIRSTTENVADIAVWETGNIAEVPLVWPL